MNINIFLIISIGEMWTQNWNFVNIFAMEYTRECCDVRDICDWHLAMTIYDSSIKSSHSQWMFVNVSIVNVVLIITSIQARIGHFLESQIFFRFGLLFVSQNQGCLCNYWLCCILNPQVAATWLTILTFDI